MWPLGRWHNGTVLLMPMKCKHGCSKSITAIPVPFSACSGTTSSSFLRLFWTVFKSYLPSDHAENLNSWLSVRAACRLPVHYVANRSLIHLAPFLLQQVKVALLPSDVLLHGLAIVARLPIDRTFKSPWQAHLKVRRKVGFESLHMNYSPATPRSFATSSNSKVSHTVLATLVKFLSKGTPRFFGSISDSYSQSLTFFSNVASRNPGSLPSHVGGGGSLPPEAAGASPQDPT